MYLCITWMVSAPFDAFTLSWLKLCCDALSCFTSMHWSLPIFITSLFLYSRIWRNFSNYSIVSVVSFSLASLSASLCSSLGCCIFKQCDIFRVAIFRNVFFHLFLKIEHLLLLLFMIPFCINSLLQCTIQLFFQLFCMVLHWLALDRNYSFLCYLWFILWFHLLWFLFLSLRDNFSLWKVVFISLQHANIYNFCNWAASSTLISPDTIIFSRDLTCSISVRLSSCIHLNCFSLGDPYGFTIVTYDGTYIVSP